MEPNTESDRTDQRTAASSLAGFGAGGQSKLTDAEVDEEEDDDGPTD